VGDCKSLKIKNARLVSNKIMHVGLPASYYIQPNMKGLVGGPLLVGGLGPGPPDPPLKSGPASWPVIRVRFKGGRGPGPQAF